LLLRVWFHHLACVRAPLQSPVHAGVVVVVVVVVVVLLLLLLR